jgi:hypothetical protein
MASKIHIFDVYLQKNFPGAKPPDPPRVGVPPLPHPPPRPSNHPPPPLNPRSATGLVSWHGRRGLAMQRLVYIPASKLDYCNALYSRIYTVRLPQAATRSKYVGVHCSSAWKGMGIYSFHLLSFIGFLLFIVLSSKLFR